MPHGDGTSAIQAVSVIKTGEAYAHHEHIDGTRKPSLWWIFFGRKRVRLPLNVYVVEHERGLVLFDAGAIRAVDADPRYQGDPMTAFFNRHIFRRHIGPQDTLTGRGGGPSTESASLGDRICIERVVAARTQPTVTNLERGPGFRSRARRPSPVTRVFGVRGGASVDKARTVLRGDSGAPVMVPVGGEFDLVLDRTRRGASSERSILLPMRRVQSNRSASSSSKLARRLRDRVARRRSASGAGGGIGSGQAPLPAAVRGWRGAAPHIRGERHRDPVVAARSEVER